MSAERLAGVAFERTGYTADDPYAVPEEYRHATLFILGPPPRVAG